MTGFGRGRAQHDDLRFEVELRSLNGKQTDVRLKLPPGLRFAEQELKKQILHRALRGRFEVSVERYHDNIAATAHPIDEALFQHYARQLQRLTPALTTDPAALVTAILRLPGVVVESEEGGGPEELSTVQRALDAAITELLNFRQQEGKVLATEFLHHLDTIEAALDTVTSFEHERHRQMRTRLERLIADNTSADAVDKNRLEQEVLYYLEKMDITEEKSRLAQHCRFFRTNLEDNSVEKGRRLGFIVQEMGREINTLGAKAHSSDIQRSVVTMKEALEKMKEQLANVV